MLGAAARKLYRWLHFWAVDYDKAPDRVIASLRAKGVKIGKGTVIYDCNLDGLLPQLITIGSGSILTHCTLLCHDDSSVVVCGRRIAAPVLIGDRCFIGYGSLILPGVTIGNDCIVGAGAVVTKSVSAGTIVAGVPARPIGTTADYRTRLQADPRLLDTDIGDVCTLAYEQSLLREALSRYRPDLR